jgi:ABC-type multidrug transport system permease subunit
MIPADVKTTLVLMRRALNEVIRVPGASIPGVLAPAIFNVGLTAVFGNFTQVTGFGTESYITFIVAIGLMQGASFSGAATGVNLARDIEQGLFDRMLLLPVPRPALLAGVVLSASLRAMLPATFLLLVTFSLGAEFPGIDGLAVALLLVALFASVAACWATALALHFKTQAAAPLMQAGMFMLILFTTSFAPMELLEGWFKEVATYNPVTQVVDGVRQGFVGDVTWADTWPALAAIAGLGAAFAAAALRGLRRMAM